MKTLIKISAILIALVSFYTLFINNAKADKACDAFIIISNNSLFEINLTVDGMPSGNLMIGKTKTYTVNLANDAPKKIKVKVEYQDPDYIDPKPLIFVTQ